jgi:hypothetical protein
MMGPIDWRRRHALLSYKAIYHLHGSKDNSRSISISAGDVRTRKSTQSSASSQMSAAYICLNTSALRNECPMFGTMHMPCLMSLPRAAHLQNFKSYQEPAVAKMSP